MKDGEMFKTRRVQSLGYTTTSSAHYFDLLPGERRTVLFRTQGIIENPAAAFRVRSLVDVQE